MEEAELKKAAPRFQDFIDRFGPLFGDEALVARAQARLRGLLLDGESKTSEAIALAVHQDESQVRMTQVFLAASPWKDGPLREELARWVDQELGDPVAGTLIIDESSFPKCGDKSVGVARQYCGASGKIDNCQVAVYIGYAGADDKNHTLLDTRLYLPKHWAKSRKRRREARVPEDVVFRTKPELALELARELRSRVRHAWLTFDEFYGRDTEFLSGLEQLGERYIGEIPVNLCGWLQRPAVEEPEGRRKKPRVALKQPKPKTVQQIAARLPDSAWERLAFRQGTKGEQQCDFARVRFFPVRDKLPGPECWLMVEKNCSQQPQTKYYISNAAADCPLLAMVKPAHSRWAIEDCFMTGKQEVGLDDYEVRGWVGWHHHMTMAMMAAWFLSLEKRQLGEKIDMGDDAARRPPALAGAAASRAAAEPGNTRRPYL